jgi:dihydrofolate reductase
VCVGTTHLVSDSIDDELRRRGVAKKHAMVKGALEIVEDALRNNEMGLTRVTHVNAHLTEACTRCQVW